jgi:hypothetical protein
MKMNPPAIILLFGLFTLTCCILSLVDRSRKGQVLFRLKK